MSRSPVSDLHSTCAWAYTRDSGGDEQTVDDQNRAVERHCQEQGYLLERLFCDRARPGSTVAGRDQFQAMMHLVRTLTADRLPDCVLFWSFSRCARDFDDAQFYKAEIRRHGVAVMSITDEIPEGPHGRLIEAVIDWKNAEFLANLSHDVKRGLHDLARRGYAPGGFPPRGYVAEKVEIGTFNNGKPRYASRWVPDPDVAPLVRQAWEMRARGSSYKEIHEQTRIFGATNSYGAMFKNRTYLGVRKCGELEIPDSHEPIISREMFDAVQGTLQKHPARGESWEHHPRNANSPFLLSGLARCAYCGAAMCGSTANIKGRPNSWPYYLCGRKKRQGYDSCPGRQIQARKAEQAVIETVVNRILVPAQVEKLLAAVNEQLEVDVADVDAKIERAHAELRETERVIANLVDLAERFGADAAGERLVQREAQKKALERELQRLRLLRQQSRIEASPEVIADVLASARDNLTGDDVQARRTFLRQYVQRIEMGNEGGKIYYIFPLDAIVSPTMLYCIPPKEFALKHCQALDMAWPA
ncbi:MAG: recombinase family protein [Anaerolineae bacterium]|nr:recombinase family protein [Anaerolineae bacterium]